jgi:hypothetical protein
MTARDAILEILCRRFGALASVKGEDADDILSALLSGHGSCVHRCVYVQRLSSGYYHVRGDGPCNWAQPAQWPCDEQELRAAAFPEASEEFIQAALRCGVSENKT